LSRFIYKYTERGSQLRSCTFAYRVSAEIIRRSLSAISKQLKGRSSAKLQKNIHSLSCDTGVNDFGVGDTAAFKTGNIKDEMVQDYYEEHRTKPIENG